MKDQRPSERPTLRTCNGKGSESRKTEFRDRRETKRIDTVSSPEHCQKRVERRRVKFRLQTSESQKRIDDPKGHVCSRSRRSRCTEDVSG